ncbi:zinc ribbon domain-containing protein [Calderihabitans maritimus]|uniref:ISChy9, transposase orfB n=1 Tax=Calderihabitans maritimus TaxID=1246530 RepID=A0A1Z5HVZ1_9FIRM|nr:zinc ribbon domain-containing protein [Calderihabitans maritimus]GAW93485.1 ISChy9, transposase orfB [Calderihabitans maritimus]
MQPCESTSKSKNTFETPSFVCEIPLRFSRAQEKKLLARLEAARQLYNACLGEAMKRVRLVRQSKLWQQAQKEPDRKQKKSLFREARSKYGFTDAAMQHYAVEIRRSCWIKEHLDVHVAQKLGTRAYRAAGRVLFGEARRVRFKGKNQMDTVEGKSNAAGIRWRNNCVAWKGLILPAIIDLKDPIIRHALSCRIKYVRLVRRKINGRNRFYAQLVCEGVPYQKPQNALGEGVVGIDIGPSTIARVNGTEAHLDRFCEELADKEAEIRRLQRKLDRSRRANNPENYNPDGTVKKGPKKWRESKTYLKTRARLAEVQRRLADHRKSLHGRMVNETLRMGNVFKFEKLSYRSLQKVFGRSVNTRAPGKFIRELTRKAESAGGKVLEFSTRLGLSSRCHCGVRKRKTLSERWHVCSCGVRCQRDLYSAYLARFVEKVKDSEFELDAGAAARQWPGAGPLLQAASGRIPNP